MDLMAEIDRQAADVADRPQDTGARLDLALLRNRAGQVDQASDDCAAVLALVPGHPGALWLSARLALDRGEAAAARASLDEVLARKDLSMTQRAETLLLAAEVHDALAAPAESFAAAAAGKGWQRTAFAATAAAHESETARYRRLAAWFGRLHDAPAPHAVPSGHVFLLGFPRSGTTLLEQVLAGHPGVSATEEAPTLTAHQRAYLADDAGCVRLGRLTAAETGQARAAYWQAVRVAGGTPPGERGTQVYLDKAPAGTLWMPLIARLFPGARVLFAVRDPRDVVLSCLRTPFMMNAMTYEFTDLSAAAACYDACMAMAEVYRRVLPLAVMDVGHEDFVADPAAGLSAIGDFIGIDVDPGMLDVAATAAQRRVQTPSGRQLRQGLNARGVGRWRAFAGEMAPVMPILAPWVARFGYGDEHG